MADINGYMNNICDRCVTDKKWCYKCRDSAEVQKILMSLPKNSYFASYVAVCPRGYSDCVRDPAYIKFEYPDWYEELYGNITPLEAIWVENGCMERYINDPDEKYYCWDNEDK